MYFPNKVRNYYLASEKYIWSCYIQYAVKETDVIKEILVKSLIFWEERVKCNSG